MAVKLRSFVWRDSSAEKEWTPYELLSGQNLKPLYQTPSSKPSSDLEEKKPPELKEPQTGE